MRRMDDDPWTMGSRKRNVTTKAGGAKASNPQVEGAKLQLEHQNLLAPAACKAQHCSPASRHPQGKREIQYCMP